ncbi:hypothetical protein LSM04_007503 [Trypanosoma melophagium]|uniref:uncharacterized protein n=1 Tax=Trypanosoma melophagium TaxID=715481 RepID=UPI00351A1B56|nr:hypothetical protein LSM04_007503 [Trypanosoma melophagium]
MLAFEASLKNEAEEVRKFTEEASKAFWRAAHRSIRIVGGRTISVEAFVAARLDEMFRYVNLTNPNPGNKKRVTMSIDKPPNGVILRNTVPLAMLELAVLFDMLHQLPPNILESFLEMIKQAESKEVVSSAPTPLSEKAPTNSSQGSLSGSSLISPTQASRRGEQLLKKTLSMSSSFKGKRNTMSWIAPYILYEQASLAFAEGDAESCHKLLGQVSDINDDQVFHAVMDSKLHFARLALQEALVKTKK